MEIIEGFNCYSPLLARTNDGFSPDSFERLSRIENKNFWFASRNRIIRYFVNKAASETRVEKYFDFLEIGCGTGYVLQGLKGVKNIQLVGSEIHVEGLKYAREKLPEVELIQLDARTIPFRDKFHAIGAFDVLEHITEDELVLENIFGALRQGGYLYITVPQYMFMWSYFDDIAFHKRRYSKAELLRKVKNSGFKIKYCGGFVFTLFPLMVLSRFIRQGKMPENENNELEVGAFANAILSIFMIMDEWLMKTGLQLPWGGSLILVAQKS